MNKRRAPVRAFLPVVATTAVLVVHVAAAAAHARISPPVSLAGAIQLYSLAVPTEEAGATTTKVVLDVPQGFSIDSFVPNPGWRRVVQEGISGSGGVTQRVTWSGGDIPTGEDALFEFLGEASSAGSFSFPVEQFYSNGSIVQWAGPESSANPAPSIKAATSLGGGGTPLLTIVALVVAVLGVVVAAVALLARGGTRQLV